MTLELNPYDAAVLALTDKFDYSISYPTDNWEEGLYVKLSAVIWLTTEQYTEWQKGIGDERRRPHPAGIR